MCASRENYFLNILPASSQGRLISHFYMCLFVMFFKASTVISLGTGGSHISTYEFN